jgi:GLPGLI family protein
MKKLIIILMAVCGFVGNTTAQTFIDKATITFEVKTNVKKTLGNSSWAEMLKDNMPQFKTGYYKFTFSNNKSVYQFDKWAEGPQVPEWLRKDDEQSIYFFDYAANKLFQQKAIIGTNFTMEDSIPAVKWRITNENREIAGFNCRKAVGIVMDSVYVFAFYTDEIVIPGGPCTINGLPGMILGLTVPRLYTSFIATKVSVNSVDEATIKPVAAKKYSSRSELKTLMTERSKEWFNSDDEDSKNWRNQFIWGTML